MSLFNRPFLLGITLISTPEGVKVSTQSETVFTAIQSSIQALHYAYVWKVQNSLFSQQLLEEVRSGVNPSSDFMQSIDLNCIAHVSLGPDKEYEKAWFHISCEKLTISMVYWNANTAALAVCLNSHQLQFFKTGDSVPHIALAKPVLQDWIDVGYFVSECEKESDWTVVPHKIKLISCSLKDCIEKAFVQNCGIISHHSTKFFKHAFFFILKQICVFVLFLAF
ncbi:hypothetical protein ILYODFUR_029113 [Ilyodon furcidens]|uniref:Uncharacterized protein n=1 Tax=Ilyodon furcidens TaxID=33524 RepID=A0ABV0UYH9_9TELE